MLGAPATCCMGKQGWMMGPMGPMGLPCSNKGCGGMAVEGLSTGLTGGASIQGSKSCKRFFLEMQSIVLLDDLLQAVLSVRHFLGQNLED